MRDAAPIWERGKRPSIRYFSQRIATASLDENHPWLKDRAGDRLSPTEELRPKLAELLPQRPLSSSIRVLDVGAGPATTLGRVHNGSAIDLTCVDVLAKEFNDELLEAGVHPPVRTQYAEAERLTDVFSDDSFDFVHSRNALDHVRDPLAAIYQMIRVCRPGCAIYIQGHVDEGKRQNYQGYHQWNFCWRDGRFVIWRPSVEVTAQDAFGDLVEISYHGTETWYEVALRKRCSTVVATGGTTRQSLGALRALSWLFRGRIGALREYRRLRGSAEFDPISYLQCYRDVRRAGVDPLAHYVLHGAREGRRPTRTYAGDQHHR